MSRPETPPKQNFIQTALFVLMAYMAFMLYMNSTKTQNNNPNGPKLVSRADYLNQLKLNDKEGKEVSGQAIFNEYKSVIDQDVKNKLISQTEGESEKIQGAVIVANGFLRGGLIMSDSNKIRNGYQLIQPFFRSDQNNPGWTTPVEVYQRNPDSVTVSHTASRSGVAPANYQPEKPFVLKSVSAKDLDSQIIETLSARNKTDLVWGVIPGGYQLIDSLVNVTGASPYFSYWFAALLLAIVVRGAVYPLAQKQLMFSRQMSQLTPRITEIKRQFQNDPTEQNKRVMGLYQEYGINPAAGCLPAFVQMPLFLTVYQCMLHYQFQFSKGYFLWINPSTSKATHGILAANLGQQDYILIVIYGITMTISTLLTPVTDPTQFKQQRLMGVGMSLAITVAMFFGVVPVVSGFVLYWTFTNLLATAQSFRAYRLPLPPLVKVNAPGGGVYPSKAPKGMWMKLMEDAQKMAQEKGQITPAIEAPSKNGVKKPPTDVTKPSNNGSANPNKNGKASSNGKHAPDAKKSTPSAQDPKNPAQDGKEPKYKPKRRG